MYVRIYGNHSKVFVFYALSARFYLVKRHYQLHLRDHRTFSADDDLKNVSKIRFAETTTKTDLVRRAKETTV